MENLSKKHEESRRDMRKRLLRIDDRELIDAYYRTITLAEHEATRRGREAYAKAAAPYG